MRRLCADREEKRVTRGSDISGQDGEQEQLDLNDPNQRSLLVGVSGSSSPLLLSLAGVMVLSGVGSGPPHHGCQGCDAARFEAT